MLHYQRTEYGKLKKVLLCRPNYLKIHTPINVIQEKHSVNNIDTELACKEHDQFINALEEEGVEVVLGHNHERYPYEVNTRDLGVTTPKGIIFGRFYSPFRWGEHRLIEQTFQENDIYIYDKHTEGTFEGGDFMYIDENTVAIGIGIRTSLVGVRQLENTLSDLGIEVITVDFAEEYLHLDMIMNVIGEKTAVICEEALPTHMIDKLKEKDFTLIKVSKDDVFLHKCNLLSIGDNTIISHNQAEDINEQLQQLGFRIIQLDLKEVLKSGGGPRCMSFPLLRE
ncbi:dimethylarginine dimethylaminohydrolase family protein [Pseudogracilibacillus auburnensis]|uniref:N-dimethylarginine dimethylaminohydrolase n=1 Tax=Pseudogracilibacillus auburnensis TaxID=1494959 RepID=A0A2V3VIN5_9BACI|nr:arginine deiminase family protein [Pseudogracilibacillus auburnensis]PXW81702.1 N-dimethylarginine dimethylaminohydrolase [Pseudogracilibacillus auburnensis]